MATEFDYDLVILDLILPQTDGVVILRPLRTRKPDSRRDSRQFARNGLGPRDIRRQSRRLEEAHDKLRLDLGRNPSEPELALEMEITLAELQKLLGQISSLEIGSLRTISPDNGKEEDLCELLPNERDESPLAQFLNSEMRELLARAIAELPEKERQVLVLYCFEELTMKEVDMALGVGESRVSQIHSMSVRLRARMTELTASRGKLVRRAAASR